MSGPEEIRLVGPGGAGKSTIGALLAERLEVAFVDLDRHLGGRIEDISEYIGRHGYDAYARENVQTYCSLFRGEFGREVVALSSGVMTYARDIHLNTPAFAASSSSTQTRSCCCHPLIVMSAWPRRFAGKSPSFRSRLSEGRGGHPSTVRDLHVLPVRKIETMRPAAASVAEIVAALSLEKK